jgi:hypothetical protein
VSPSRRRPTAGLWPSAKYLDVKILHVLSVVQLGALKVGKGTNRLDRSKIVRVSFYLEFRSSARHMPQYRQSFECVDAAVLRIV